MFLGATIHIFIPKDRYLLESFAGTLTTAFASLDASCRCVFNQQKNCVSITALEKSLNAAKFFTAIDANSMNYVLSQP